MKHDSTLNKGHRAARTAAAYAKYDIYNRVATKSEKTGRPDWMSPASKCKLKAEADSKYVARRAGRDDAPLHDATSKPDTLDGVVNAGFEVNKTTEAASVGNNTYSGKEFEAELAAMYRTPETPAQRLEREAESRNRLWSKK
jgi:hypothetical protein